jgi:hypothetical protein
MGGTKRRSAKGKPWNTETHHPTSEDTKNHAKRSNRLSDNGIVMSPFSSSIALPRIVWTIGFRFEHFPFGLRRPRKVDGGRQRPMVIIRSILLFARIYHLLAQTATTTRQFPPRKASVEKESSSSETLAIAVYANLSNVARNDQCHSTGREQFSLGGPRSSIYSSSSSSVLAAFFTCTGFSK